MTFDEFKVLVKGMKAVYTSPNFLPDGDSIKIWFRMLQDLPYELANLSVQKYMLTNKFPPTIADIREVSANAMTNVSDWSEAWGKVVKCFGLFGADGIKEVEQYLDPVTFEAVKRMGWKDMCMSDAPDVLRAQFRQIYQQVSVKEKEMLSLPPTIRTRMAGLLEGARNE